MARPIKTGLDYFPHDCDASSDEKIEALRAIHGNDGYTFFFIACERIYRSNNLELIISDAETKQIFAKKVSVTPQKLEEMIQTALKFNCFDRDAYEKRGVLTSCGIKKRAQTVLEKRKKMRSIYQNRVSDAETKEETREETSQETPQSKEKKRNIYTNKPENADLESEVEKIYQLYPYRDGSNNSRSTGKSSKCKLKIKSILKTGYPLAEAIKKYLDECKTKKVYLKNFSTFLNNLPDTQEPEPKNPEPIRPVIEQNPWAKIRREAQQEAANATE